MKINFNGAYRDIQKYVQASAVQPERIPTTEEFPELLSDISPNRVEIADLEPNSKIQGRPDSEEADSNSGPLARFNFNAPELSIPELEPQSPPVPVNEPLPSVKTPTVLEVRRAESGVKAEAIPDQTVADSGDYRRMIEEAGAKHGIDPVLGLAVAEAESNFNPQAVSNDGHASKGLFQLLDRTGKHLLSKMDSNEKYNPFDPKLNIDLGVSYLRHLHQIFSQPSDLPNKLTTVAAANSSSLEKFAIAAFNAGEGRVAHAQQQATRLGRDAAVFEDVEEYLPDTTRTYVQRVLGRKAVFGGADIG